MADIVLVSPILILDTYDSPSARSSSSRTAQNVELNSLDLYVRA
jgi:hypothetical protein